MTELKIGYARVSTAGQDLTAQRDGLAALGVDPDRIYVDHGLTGTNRARPGLREALAACRAGGYAALAGPQCWQRHGTRYGPTRTVSALTSTATGVLYLGPDPEAHEPILECELLGTNLNSCRRAGD